MRLWTLHPVYLDARGLTACWRKKSSPDKHKATAIIRSCNAFASPATPSPR